MKLAAAILRGRLLGGGVLPAQYCPCDNDSRRPPGAVAAFSRFRRRDISDLTFLFSYLRCTCVREMNFLVSALQTDSHADGHADRKHYPASFVGGKNTVTVLLTLACPRRWQLKLPLLAVFWRYFLVFGRSGLCRPRIPQATSPT